MTLHPNVIPIRAGRDENSEAAHLPMVELAEKSGGFIEAFRERLFGPSYFGYRKAKLIISLLKARLFFEKIEDKAYRYYSRQLEGQDIATLLLQLQIVYHGEQFSVAYTLALIEAIEYRFNHPSPLAELEPIEGDALLWSRIRTCAEYHYPKKGRKAILALEKWAEQLCNGPITKIEPRKEWLALLEGLSLPDLFERILRLSSQQTVVLDELVAIFSVIRKKMGL